MMPTTLVPGHDTHKIVPGRQNDVFDIGLYQTRPACHDIERKIAVSGHEHGSMRHVVHERASAPISTGAGAVSRAAHLSYRSE